MISTIIGRILSIITNMMFSLIIIQFFKLVTKTQAIEKHALTKAIFLVCLVCDISMAGGSNQPDEVICFLILFPLLRNYALFISSSAF